MRTVTVEVPEGHMVKIVKEESMKPPQKVVYGGEFDFEGETFISGDVIINPNRGGGCMMILSEIREERLLPLLLAPAMKVPFGLVTYVPSNNEGDRVFISSTPEAGIGSMKGFRKATEEEKAKMLAAVKEEKHYSFNFEKLQPKYIPTIGDVVIVWNDSIKEAVVGLLSEIDNSGSMLPYKTNESSWYKHCTRLFSEKQYKDFINEEK